MTPLAKAEQKHLPSADAALFTYLGRRYACDVREPSPALLVLRPLIDLAKDPFDFLKAGLDMIDAESDLPNLGDAPVMKKLRTQVSD